MLGQTPGRQRVKTIIVRLMNGGLCREGGREGRGGRGREAIERQRVFINQSLKAKGYSNNVAYRLSSEIEKDLLHECLISLISNESDGLWWGRAWGMDP